MKLYQYNTESGVYTGELFEDSGSIQYDEGVTTITPPLYGPGQVPVFNITSGKWDILPVGTVRQLLHLKSERQKQ